MEIEMEYDNTLTKKQHLEKLQGVDIKQALRLATDNVVKTADLLDGTQQWYVKGDGIWFRKKFWPWEVVYKAVNHMLPQKQKEPNGNNGNNRFSLTSRLFSTKQVDSTTQEIEEKNSLVIELKKEVDKLKEIIRQQSTLLDQHIAGSTDNIPLIMKGLGLRKKIDVGPDGYRVIRVQLMYFNHLLGDVQV